MQRIENLKNYLKKGEAALINSEANRLYYTGFASSAGWLAVTKDKALFLVDFRYYEKARNTVTGCDVVLCDKLYTQLYDFFTDQNTETVFLETETVSLDRFSSYKNNLPDFNFSSDVCLQSFITKQRSIKSSDEIAKIREAQRLTDETFSYILNRIKPGRTERDIMLDMEFFMRKAGSDGVSFDFIVVSGKNSSMPHGVPTDKRIEAGDFVTMDFGAVSCGYRSDMTRTVAVGKVTDKQRLVYETVLKAQNETIDFIKPGVRCLDVDKKARDIIYGAGFEGCFGHGLGHSVGIEIHENPSCNMSCETEMLPGMIMTVEPGIYIENEFGVRIEDMVVVTDTGCTDITKSDKSLIII